MSLGRFHRALRGEALDVPPIWLMRQAGRYHARYRQLRARHSFEALCRTPPLAAEVAMGPMWDFDFDAAILFSDLLFPLEALGFGLSYDDGPPKLDGSLTFDRVAQFRSLPEALERLAFQGAAMRETRRQLPADKALLGFVGGPWTLFVYAMEGTHAGPLSRAKASLDLYRAFADRLVPLLVENIALQLEAGADLVMIFDTAAGELPPETFKAVMAPDLATLARAYPTRLGYYANAWGPAHVEPEFAQLWAGLGLDWRWDLATALREEPRHGFVQGNFDPVALQLTGQRLEREIDRFIEPLKQLDPNARRGWICGLGHGVLPGTPEESVRTFVKRVRESFAAGSSS
jgi:uroporphyrinogen decarboxylase